MYLSNNLEADPLFVDLAGGDYQLASGSPAIDSGTAAGAADDYLGTGRGIVAVDRGAFEQTADLFADGFESGAPTRWSGAEP